MIYAKLCGCWSHVCQTVAIAVVYAKLCGYLCHVCQTVMAYALCKMPNSMALNIMCANNIVHAITFAILTIYLHHKLEAYTYIPG